MTVPKLLKTIFRELTSAKIKQVRESGRAVILVTLIS